MRFEHPLSDVRAIKYASIGKSLVSVSNLGGVTIWNAKTGKMTSAFHANDISDDISGSVALSPDCSMLAIGLDDGSIEVRNIQNGRLVSYARGYARHLVVVNTIAFDQDSRRLVSGYCDRTIKVWDLPTSTKRSFPAEKMEVRLALKGHKVRDTQYVPT